MERCNRSSRNSYHHSNRAIKIHVGDDMKTAIADVGAQATCFMLIDLYVSVIQFLTLSDFRF